MIRFKPIQIGRRFWESKYVIPAKNDATKGHTQVKLVAQLTVQSIITQLHEKAVEMAQKAVNGILVENTIVDQEKKAFNGAGEHMIVVRREKDGISKDEAVKALNEYTHWFIGPDENISDSQVRPLPDENDGKEEERKEAEKKAAEQDKKDQEEGVESPEEAAEKEKEKSGTVHLDESFFDMSFNQFLHEADDEEDEGPGGESASKEAKSEEAKPEEAGSSKGIVDGDGNSSGSGYYIAYKMHIKGQPETALKDAVKKWGSEFLKGFGVRLGSGWGQYGSIEGHTVKDLERGLKDVFGKIDDPEKLVSTIQANFRKQYPHVGGNLQVDVRDAQTLIKELDRTKHPEYTGKVKTQIAGSDYSLVIGVSNVDLRKPFLNTRSVAAVVTTSIKGLFKKFRHGVKANDVIYLTGDPLNGDSQGDKYTERSRISTPADFAHKFAKSLETLNKNPTPANIVAVVSNISQFFKKMMKDTQLASSDATKNVCAPWVNKYQKLFDQNVTKPLNELGMTSKDTKKLKELAGIVDKLVDGLNKEYTKAYEDNRSDIEQVNADLSESNTSIVKRITGKLFGNKNYRPVVHHAIGSQSRRSGVSLMSKLFESFDIGDQISYMFEHDVDDDNDENYDADNDNDEDNFDKELGITYDDKKDAAFLKIKQHLHIQIHGGAERLAKAGKSGKGMSNQHGDFPSIVSKASAIPAFLDKWGVEAKSSIIERSKKYKYAAAFIFKVTDYTKDENGKKIVKSIQLYDSKGPVFNAPTKKRKEPTPKMKELWGTLGNDSLFGERVQKKLFDPIFGQNSPLFNGEKIECDYAINTGRSKSWPYYFDSKYSKYTIQHYGDEVMALTKAHIAFFNLDEDQDVNPSVIPSPSPIPPGSASPSPIPPGSASPSPSPSPATDSKPVEPPPEPDDDEPDDDKPKDIEIDDEQHKKSESTSITFIIPMPGLEYKNTEYDEERY